MRWGIVALALALVGCGDDEPERPTSCDAATQRVGTYMLSYTEVSGTCGPINSELVSFDPAAGAGNGCTINSETFSEGGCKLERTVSCVSEVRDETQWGGVATVTNDSTAVTYQRTQDGSRLEGTITMSLSDGRNSCRSTYNVMAVRQ
jgi:hypothetical protein